MTFCTRIPACLFSFMMLLLWILQVCNSVTILITLHSRFLAIPPNQRDVAVHATCAPICTSVLPWPIHVSDVLIHMHYLGNKGYINHKRGNATVTEFVKLDDYSYDSPVFYK